MILSTNKNVESGPEDLVLTGVIRGRLYLGSKYRYEMEVDGVNEPVFINHGSDVETGTEVKVVVPKGSYFIF